MDDEQLQLDDNLWRGFLPPDAGQEPLRYAGHDNELDEHDENEQENEQEQEEQEQEQEQEDLDNESTRSSSTVEQEVDGRGVDSGRRQSLFGGHGQHHRRRPWSRRDELPAQTEQAPASRSSPSSSSSSSGSASPRSRLRATTKELHLQQYRDRDLVHAAALVDQGQRHHQLLHSLKAEVDHYQSLASLRRTNPGAVFGPGYAKYPPMAKTVLVYPKDRKRNRVTRELRLSRQQSAMQALEPQNLVPVRLDVDLDKYKIRDTFTWNMHEKAITFAYFAQTLVEDFEIPVSQHTVSTVSRAIQEQISDFHPHVLPTDSPHGDTINGIGAEMVPREEDMRILVKLDITIGPHHLLDAFEWDINNPDNDPETFAAQMCADLCLSGEFVTAIAHSVREQAQNYTRVLFMVGHPFDGWPIEDEGVRAHLMATIQNPVRAPQFLANFSPQLIELTEDDLDRADKDRERETRRKRRQGRAATGRRGAPQLPDLAEPIRTYRSCVINSTLPGAIPNAPEIHEHVFHEAESDDDDQSLPRTQVIYPRLHPDVERSLIVKLRVPGLAEYMARRLAKTEPEHT